MIISAVSLVVFVACLLGLRAMNERPQWDLPTDVGMLWALRLGVVACPIVAVLGPFLT